MSTPDPGPKPDFSALLASEEPLHPDLAPYFEEHPRIGSMLRHPLVYMVGGVRPGLANAMYERKRARLDRARAAGEWHTYVFLHERPWRLDALADLDTTERLPGPVFWRLLGEIWTDSENIAQNREAWEFLLSDDRPGREHLMVEDDRAEYAVLPDPVRVYRGAAAGINENGLSWTRDHDQARWFARRLRKPGEAAVVLCGTVAKADVLAVFGNRGEDEILVADSTAVTVEHTEPA